MRCRRGWAGAKATATDTATGTAPASSSAPRTPTPASDSTGSLNETNSPFWRSFSTTSSTATAEQGSPIGGWKTLDDETGKPMTISEVYLAKNGMLSAKIVENLGLPPTCTDCSGQYKGKPFVGIVTLWNLKPMDGGWGGGNGYKPSEDHKFKVKSVKLVADGNKMEVPGCVMVFCKTATWVRVP